MGAVKTSKLKKRRLETRMLRLQLERARMAERRLLRQCQEQEQRSSQIRCFGVQHCFPPAEIAAAPSGLISKVKEQMVEALINTMMHTPGIFFFKENTGRLGERIITLELGVVERMEDNHEYTGGPRCFDLQGLVLRRVPERPFQSGESELLGHS